MNDKSIMKDGKPHKIAQVVMLPTNDQTQIAKGHDNNRFIYADKPMSDTQNNRAGYMNQHLYILSSEEIKEGDWCIDDNNYIFKMTAEFIKNNTHHNWQEYYKKIIATTDEALTYKISVDCGSSIGNTLHTKNLPRPSDDFLKAFVKANGKGFDKVLVEYIKLEEPTDDGNSKKYIQYDLKIAPDNIITIKPVEKGKKDYGIEYLKFIATRFAHECRLKGVVSNHETCTLFDKWIKENL